MGPTVHQGGHLILGRFVGVADVDRDGPAFVLDVDPGQTAPLPEFAHDLLADHPGAMLLFGFRASQTPVGQAPIQPAAAAQEESRYVHARFQVGDGPAGEDGAFEVADARQVRSIRRQAGCRAAAVRSGTSGLSVPSKSKTQRVTAGVFRASGTRPPPR